MARIRSIKPEFPQSETIGRLSRDARLLFIQLWTIVDDEGRARAASRMLASLLYPYDDEAPALIEGWLGELEKQECIVRYEVGGTRYLEIVNWLKHQKIDKPSKSKLPPFAEASRIVAKAREASAPDLGSRTRDLGEGSSEAIASGAADAPPMPQAANDPVRPDPAEAERELFRRGKQVLGSGAGNTIAQLLKSQGGNVALARAGIERASQAEDPKQFVYGVINGSRAPPRRSGQQNAGALWADNLLNDINLGRTDDHASANYRQQQPHGPDTGHGPTRIPLLEQDRRGTVRPVDDRGQRRSFGG